jgi:hypothetical protein
MTDSVKFTCVKNIVDSLPYRSTVLAINYNTLCRPDLIVTRLKQYVKIGKNSFDAIIIYQQDYIKIINEIDNILEENGICIIISDNGFDWIAWKYKYKQIRYWIIDNQSKL